MDADEERIMAGEEPTDPEESENAVTDVPPQFTQWLEDNAERIATAKSRPYFLTDNYENGDPEKPTWRTERPEPAQPEADRLLVRAQQTIELAKQYGKEGAVKRLELVLESGDREAIEREVKLRRSVLRFDVVDQLKLNRMRRTIAGLPLQPTEANKLVREIERIEKKLHAEGDIGRAFFNLKYKLNKIQEEYEFETDAKQPVTPVPAVEEKPQPRVNIADEWDLKSITPADLQNSALKDMDLIGLKKSMLEIAEKHGIQISEWTIKPYLEEDNTITIQINSSGFELLRIFTIEKDGSITATHAIFAVDEEYQGSGLSRQVLGAFYEEYKKMSVKRIGCYANMDVGGYCWARYGFQTTVREAIGAIKEDNMYNKKDAKLASTAVRFVEDYCRKHGLSDGDLFPMNVIAEQPWAKELLLGSSWSGSLDLKSSEQTKIFESYLSRR